MTRVKICGLTRSQDLVTALTYGADAVGFVFEPTSPRCVAREPWQAFLKLVGPYATSVAVYGRTHGPIPPTRAVQAIEFDVPPADHQERIKVVRLGSGMAAGEVLQLAKGARALCLDALSEEQMGGTGLTIDWGTAAAVVRGFGGPVILSGGLTPENVADAVKRVRPYAVDVSSGVERSPGIKDPIKVRDFIQAAKGALK